MASKNRIQKLFKILKIDEQFETSIKNTASVFKNKYSAMCLECGITPDEFERIITEPAASLKNPLREQVEQIYRDLFTNEEVDELIAIYASSAFQRWLELAPEIHKRVTVFVAGEMGEIQAQMEEKFEALLSAKESGSRPRRLS